eukprot:9363685-Pyramimonas_sp.AAC.1
MRATFATARRGPQLEKAPARSTVEHMLKNIGAAPLKPEKLSDVVDAEQGDGGEFKPVKTQDGAQKTTEVVP